MNDLNAKMNDFITLGFCANKYRKYKMTSMGHIDSTFQCDN